MADDTPRPRHPGGRPRWVDERRGTRTIRLTEGEYRTIADAAVMAGTTPAEYIRTTTMTAATAALGAAIPTP